MAQWVKCLLQKHEILHLQPQLVLGAGLGWRQTDLQMLESP